MAPRGVPWETRGDRGVRDRGQWSLKALLKIAVALGIVVSTYYAMLRIGEHKIDALAGGGTFLLDGRHAAENDALDALTGSSGSGRRSTSRRPSPGCAPRGTSGSRPGSREGEAPSTPTPWASCRGSTFEKTSWWAEAPLSPTSTYPTRHGAPSRGSGWPGPSSTSSSTTRAWRTSAPPTTGRSRGIGDSASAHAERLSGEERRSFDWAVASAIESAAAAREKATGTTSP